MNCILSFFVAPYIEGKLLLSFHMVSIIVFSNMMSFAPLRYRFFFFFFFHALLFSNAARSQSV
jgi:hypothetical protein